jgi:hypothetical protein
MMAVAPPLSIGWALLLQLVLGTSAVHASYSEHLDAFIDTWRPFGGVGSSPAGKQSVYPSVRYDDSSVDVDVAVVAIFKGELPCVVERCIAPA